MMMGALESDSGRVEGTPEDGVCVTLTLMLGVEILGVCVDRDGELGRGINAGEACYKIAGNQ